MSIITLIIQIYLVLLFSIVSLINLSDNPVFAAVGLIVTIILCLAILDLKKTKKWASVVWILVAGIIFIYTLINFVMNFFMFIRGSNLYLDSPATILIVATYFTVITIPTGIVTYRLWRQHKVLF